MSRFRRSPAASAMALLLPFAAAAADQPDVVAQAASPDNRAAQPPSSAASAASSTAAAQSLAPVQITARRFKEARIDLVPKVGTTVYTIDQGLIGTLGQGDATPFTEVLQRLPGVAKDSKASGSLHVRDDHGNVQYRIDGVQLP